MVRLRSALLLSCLGCRSILGLDDYTDQAPPGAGAGGGSGSGGGDGGAAGGAPSQVIWNVRLGDSGSTSATGVAVNDDGSIVVVGMFDESITFEGAPHVVDTPQLYVAKLDANGAPLWGKKFDVRGDARPRVAVLPSRIFVAGALYDTANFGTGVLPHAGGADVLLLMFDQDGELMTSGAWGTSGEDFASDVVTTGDGHAILCGDYGHGATGAGLTFGSSELALNGNQTSNAFVVKLDEDLFPLFVEAAAAGAASTTSCRRAAMGTNGVIVTGSFNGSADFDGTSKTSGNADDFYAWALTGDGTGSWVKEHGSTDVQVAPSVAVDSTGNTVLAGKLAGEVDFGGSVNAIGTAGDPLLYVVALSGSDTVALSHVVLGAADGHLEVVADSAEDIVVAGAFAGILEGPAGAVTSAGTGTQDVIIARMHRQTSELVFDWFMTGGDSEEQRASDVALGAESVVVAGTMGGTLELDRAKALVSDGVLHAFVAKLQR